MKKFKNQKGFIALEFLLIPVLVILVGFTGWFVWNAKNNSNKSLNASIKEDASQTNKIASSTGINANKSAAASAKTQTTTTPTTKSTSSSTSAPKSSTTATASASASKPTAFNLSYLDNSGMPNTSIPAGQSSFTMTCYKGAGSPDNGSYTITAETSQGDVQTTMCYYQSFTANILSSGTAARLYLADSQYIDVPLKGGGPGYQATCDGSPATGPWVPVDINGAIVDVQICSNYKFATTPVY